MKNTIWLVLLCIVMVSSKESSSAFRMDEKLIDLRRKEMACDVQLERMKVDLPLIEQKWHEVRSARTVTILNDDSLNEEQSSLEALVLLEQLNTSRHHIENVRFLKKLYQNHQNLRKRFLDMDSSSTIALLDSYLDTLTMVTDEARTHAAWTENQNTHFLFEKTSIQALLREDTIKKADRDLYSMRIHYLEQQQNKDSITLAAIGSTIGALNKYQQFVDSLMQQKTFANKTVEFMGIVLRIWDYPLYQGDGKPITIGKVVFALLLIILGLKVAQLISYRTSGYIARRFLIEQGVVDAGQKLFFYAFALGFVMYALHVMQFPLTAFTFAGGALALGIGFGSQNVLNNFISGIILLLERPIKTKDLIEIEGAMGEIESIGLRSTRIRTSGNTHMVLPNSSFLEKNVINWTLSDRKVRLELSVGVSYGTSAELVKELLLEVAKESPDSLSTPVANVLFTDFGDSALIFNLLFWVKIQKLTDRRVILSALRFAIYKKFAEHGVVIAFPQLDVHLIKDVVTDQKDAAH